MKDNAGNSWEAFEDEYQRRKLRNVATGEAIDDPRSGDARMWVQPKPAPDLRTPMERALDGD